MLDTYRELVDLLVATPTAMRDAVAAASDPPAGEWSAAQVMAHMAAAEAYFLGLLNLILNQRDALLKAPSPEVATLEQSLMVQDSEANLAEFNARRGETISLIMGLSLNDWGRTGVSNTSGTLSIEDIIEMIVSHDNEHLNQLRALAP